ncbi:MAG: alpha/beta fold hydrolase [Archangiaceae bacterium]|nr:alpha/beta fold hydrolase [Archangiaceae bacterium]
MRTLTWSPDQLYRPLTADGAHIGLGRYLPRGERRFVEPVVLAHGMGANRFDLDFDETYSLARYLARRGFESWVLELRGRGHAGFHGRDTSFDDQAEHDVAAALRTIGQPVLWVGHSKGGLIAYAHLAQNLEAPIRALVTLGTPIRFDHDRVLSAFLTLARPLYALPLMPIRAAAAVGANVTGLPPEPFGSYMLRPENMDPEVLALAMRHVPSDIFGGVARQFFRWMRTGRVDSNRGFDYRAAFANVRAPLLMIAGTHDKLAPPDNVFATRPVWGGPVHAHLAQGFGHGDLTIGRDAPREIFPKVAEFLEAHATRAGD